MRDAHESTSNVEKPAKSSVRNTTDGHSSPHHVVAAPPAATPGGICACGTTPKATKKPPLVRTKNGAAPKRTARAHTKHLCLDSARTHSRQGRIVPATTPNMIPPLPRALTDPASHALCRGVYLSSRTTTTRTGRRQVQQETADQSRVAVHPPSGRIARTTNLTWRMLTVWAGKS